MIQDLFEVSERAERVGEVEQEAGASPLVVAAEKLSRGVYVFPVEIPRSLARPYVWKRTT